MSFQLDYARQTGLAANSTKLLREDFVSNFDFTFRPYLEEWLKSRISTREGRVSAAVNGSLTTEFKHCFSLNLNRNN